MILTIVLPTPARTVEHVLITIVVINATVPLGTMVEIVSILRVHALLIPAWMVDSVYQNFMNFMDACVLSHFMATIVKIKSGALIIPVSMEESVLREEVAIVVSVHQSIMVTNASTITCVTLIPASMKEFVLIKWAVISATVQLNIMAMTVNIITRVFPVPVLTVELVLSMAVAISVTVQQSIMGMSVNIGTIVLLTRVKMVEHAQTKVTVVAINVIVVHSIMEMSVNIWMHVILIPA